MPHLCEGLRFRVRLSFTTFHNAGVVFRVPRSMRRVSDFVFRVPRFGFRIPRFGFRVSCFVFRVPGSMFQVLGLLFRGHAPVGGGERAHEALELPAEYHSRLVQRRLFVVDGLIREVRGLETLLTMRTLITFDRNS